MCSTTLYIFFSMETISRKKRRSIFIGVCFRYKLEWAQNKKKKTECFEAESRLWTKVMTSLLPINPNDEQSLSPLAGITSSKPSKMRYPSVKNFSTENWKISTLDIYHEGNGPRKNWYLDIFGWIVFWLVSWLLTGYWLTLGWLADYWLHTDCLATGWPTTGW